MTDPQRELPLNPEDARRARDEALDSVRQNAGKPFKLQVYELVRSLPEGTKVTGESIRLRCEERGIEPHHHNAWGAVIRGMIGSLLHPTGDHVAMKTERSHARRTPVYRVIDLTGEG